MSDTVKILISAQLDPGDIQAALNKLRDQLNRFGQEVAAANKVKFNPIDSASLDDMRKIERGFEQLKRVQADMRRRMRATGQEGTGFFDIDWQRLHPDSGARARQQRRAFEYVTGLGFEGVEPPADATFRPGGVPRLPPAPMAVPRPNRPPAPRIPPSPATYVTSVARQGLNGAHLNVEGTFHLMGPTGVPAATPVIIQTQVGASQPSGM
jgi:hypothetical protein